VTAGPIFSLTADEQGRIEQIDRWVALGVGGVPPLIAAMADPSWTVRRATVAALAALGDDAAGPLCAWLSDRRTSEHEIAAAVDALASSIGPAVTREVMALLEHPTPAVIADAAHILGRRRATEATPALGRLIAHADDNVAVAAIEALGAIGGSAAVEPLIAALARRSFFRTFPTLQVLPRTGDPRVIAPLAALLREDTYRIEAARALGRTGSPLAIAPLASILPASGGDALVRLVARALADLVARAEWSGAADRVIVEMRRVIAPSLDRFIGALRAADPEERAAIASLLGRIGDARVLPALARLLDDPAMVEATTAAIQRIGLADDAAMTHALRSQDPAVRIAALPVVNGRRMAPDVRDLLHDDDPEVQARACDALARTGDTSAVPALFALLGNPSSRVAHAAAAAIQSLGTAETGSLAIAAVQTGEPAVRRQALRIIGYLGCDGAYEVSRRAVEDPDRRIAELAVTALGAVDDPRVEPALAELASGASEVLRAAAMRAIAQRASAHAIELLERGLADDAAWVRYYACQGLGRLGHVSSTSLLIARLADSTAHVRIAAIEALAHVDTAAAWQALSSAARSSDPDQRRAALIGIGLRSTRDALPFLLAALASEDAATRLIAISGLAQRSEPEASDALGRAALDAAPDVRDAALSLLGERTDRAAADVLVAAALATEPDHPAHLALSRAGGARIAAIRARLGDASERDATALVAALARTHDEAATAALFELLELPHPVVRRIAAAALVAMDAVGARGRVARLAADDPDPEVRRACAAAVE
jgi:HEAT repeat protein